jgi:hypothetical protein
LAIYSTTLIIGKMGREREEGGREKGAGSRGSRGEKNIMCVVNSVLAKKDRILILLIFRF